MPLESKPIQKKKPFIPPLLGAKNLGMSTLVQANGKTQEEMDVESQMLANKAQDKPQPKPMPPQEQATKQLDA